MSAALRLYVGHSEATTVSVPPRRWTLRQAYERALLPDLKREGRAPATLREYLTTLNLWEQFTPLRVAELREQGEPVSELGIGILTDDDLSSFGDWLAGPERSGRTVNKHLGNVEAILKRCGPRGPHNRFGKRHLDEFVFVPRHSEADSESVVHTCSREDFLRLYSACRLARMPQYGSQPAQAWRAVLLLLWTFGPRRNDAFLMEQSSVVFDRRCPLPDVREEHEHGWLIWTPRKTRRMKPQRLCLPLTPALNWHLRQVVGRDGRLFPFNRGFRGWRDEFNRLRYAAGIETPFTFKGLRKTANVEWDNVELGIGSHVLGHAPRDVNSRHYRNLISKLCELITHYPFADLHPNPKEELQC